MRVLVVYATAYGATKGIAERIADTLRERGLTADLFSADDPDLRELDLADYEGFVIGSAIHAGSWLKSAVEFVRDNRDILAVRPVWLFSSGPIGERAVGAPQPDPKQIDEFRGALEVKDHVVFGGAFDPNTADLSRASWLERQVVARLLPSGDYRNWEDISAWASRIAWKLDPVLVP